MKKFLVGVKKFFSNKNTVTIVCVLGAILVIYFGYNYRIDQITSPVRVPYAKVEIQPRTELLLTRLLLIILLLILMMLLVTMQIIIL